MTQSSDALAASPSPRVSRAPSSSPYAADGGQTGGQDFDTLMDGKAANDRPTPDRATKNTRSGTSGASEAGAAAAAATTQPAADAKAPADAAGTDTAAGAASKDETASSEKTPAGEDAKTPVAVSVETHPVPVDPAALAAAGAALAAVALPVAPKVADAQPAAPTGAPTAEPVAQAAAQPLPTATPISPEPALPVAAQASAADPAAAAKDGSPAQSQGDATAVPGLSIPPQAAGAKADAKPVSDTPSVNGAVAPQADTVATPVATDPDAVVASPVVAAPPALVAEASPAADSAAAAVKPAKPAEADGKTARTAASTTPGAAKPDATDATVIAKAVQAAANREGGDASTRQDAGTPSNGDSQTDTTTSSSTTTGTPVFSTTTTTHTVTASVTHTATGAARPPMAQLADPLVRVAERGGGEFQIDLDPADLGHVRIIAEVNDGRVALTVQAANADTLNMLRRDIHQLQATLSDAGFELDGGTLNFSLQGDGQSHGSEGFAGGGGQRSYRPVEETAAVPREWTPLHIDGLVDVTV